MIGKKEKLWNFGHGLITEFSNLHKLLEGNNELFNRI